MVKRLIGSALMVMSLGIMTMWACALVHDAYVSVVQPHGTMLKFMIEYSGSPVASFIVYWFAWPAIALLLMKLADDRLRDTE